jgi:polar amino acid transport system permease protein
VAPPFDLLPPLLEGLWITLQITLGGAVVAIVFSLLGGMGRLSRFAMVRWTSVVYIEVFRGTSALVQLFWFYFVLPLFGIHLDGKLVGVLVLGLNGGSYGAEIVRGAILAVPKGQYEAATALNFSRVQTLWRIILPQAFPLMLPPMGNILIELLKNTALISQITIAELTFTGQTLRFDTLRTTEIFGIILVLYFLVALCITAMIRGLERWSSRGIVRGGVA